MFISLPEGVCDVHVHVGSLPQLKVSFSLEDLVKIMDKCRIGKALVFSSYIDPERETKQILKTIVTDRRLYGLVRAKPSKYQTSKFLKWLEHLLVENPHIIGVKIMDRVPCSGCSLLCDDILIRSDGLFIEEVSGACLKGKERFEQVSSKNRILTPLTRTNGELSKTSWEDALENTVEIIKNSSKPLLYGFSNVTCEAQLKGIEFAKAIDGFIDSNSIICQGRILNVAKKTGITLTTLSEIINKADLLVLWDTNVAESIPRLLNKALFSRGKFRMTGREIKTLVIIDPVKTASFN